MFESRLIRLEGFNNKISTIFSVCSTWPSGKAFARCVEGPELEIEPITFFSLLLFFFSFFFLFFSFSFHFRYNSFVMFLYIAYNFFLSPFSASREFPSRLYLPFPRSPSRGPAIYVFLV